MAYIRKERMKVRVEFIPKDGEINHNNAIDYKPISLSSFSLKSLELSIYVYVRGIVTVQNVCWAAVWTLTEKVNYSITVARNYAGYSPLDIFIKNIVRFTTPGVWRTKAEPLWKRYYFKRDGQLWGSIIYCQISILLEKKRVSNFVLGTTLFQLSLMVKNRNGYRFRNIIIWSGYYCIP